MEDRDDGVDASSNPESDSPSAFAADVVSEEIAAEEGELISDSEIVLEALDDAEVEAEAADATTAPPAAVSAPMALDWEDEEDATLVYEREESPYQAEAKVVIDEGLASVDEAPTRRHERAHPSSFPPPASFVPAASSPARLRETAVRRRVVDGPSGERAGRSTASRGELPPPHMPPQRVSLLPIPSAPPFKTSPTLPNSALANSAVANSAVANSASAMASPTKTPLTLTPSMHPALGGTRPISVLPPPPFPARPAGLGSTLGAGPHPVVSPLAARPTDDEDIPRQLPFGRRNEPTMVQPVRHVPSSVPPMVAAPRSTRGEQERGRVWIALGAAATIAVAAVVAGFFFMPRKGQLEIVVQDEDGNSVRTAEVFLDGKKHCDKAPCVVRDLPTGSKLVRAVAPGFTGEGPVTAEVVAGDGNRVVVKVRPSMASLKVGGTQEGIRVSVDGTDRGTLPIDLSDLEPGEHELRFDGGVRYEVVTRTIEVEAGETEELGDVVLPVVKGQVEIDLVTEGASVTIERESGARSLREGRLAKAVAGPFPRTLELDGEHEWRIVATKKGLPDFVQTVDFADGQAKKKVAVSLEEPSSDDEASASDASSVSASSLPVGSAPAAVSSPKSDAAAPAAAPPADEKVGGKVGMLNVNSIPVSRVLVDGNALGETPRTNIELPPGIHTVTFVHPDLGRKSVSVNIKPGQTATAAVKLRDD